MAHLIVEPRLAFRDYAISPTSSCLSASTTSSDGTSLGPGADFGRVLFWIGEHVLDTAVDIAINARLLFIFFSVAHRSDTTELNLKDVRRLQTVCLDLLELCRPDYPLRVIRRSLSLILAILRPLSTQSILLLNSDFVDVLECEVEEYDDEISNELASQILRIADAFRELPCQCVFCLRSPSVANKLGYRWCQKRKTLHWPVQGTYEWMNRRRYFQRFPVSPRLAHEVGLSSNWQIQSDR